MGYRHIAIAIVISMLAVSLTTAATDMEPMADTAGPVFENDTTPGNGIVGQPLMFSVNITDETGVANATLEWWQGSGTHNKVNMSLANGNNTTGTWTTTITPVGSRTNIDYIFHSYDDLGNYNSTAPGRFITLSDINPPKVDDFTTQISGPPSTGDDFSFYANVSDDVQISQVRVHYMVGAPPWLDTNVTMDPLTVDNRGNGLYVLNLTVFTNSTENIRYQLWARDTSNHVSVVDGQIKVLDNDIPEFAGDRSDTEGTTGDVFHFEADVSDNVGVDKVKAFWSYGSESPKNQTMTAINVDPVGNGKYGLDVTLPDDFEGILWYQLMVGDPSNRWNFSAYTEVNVRDNDGPVVGPDMSVPVGEDRFDFVVNVTDNIGVDMVWVVYSFVGESPSNVTMTPVDVVDGNGTYGNVGVAIPLDRQVELDYTIGAVDVNGFVTKLYGSYENLDSEMPTFGAFGSVGEAVKGLSIDVWVEAFDNFGVDAVDIEYRFGDGAPKVDTMVLMGSTYNYTIHIPRYPVGNLTYFFNASDVKGNWNVTQVFEVEPVNLAPEVGTVPVWEITEAENDMFDLQGYLSDGNDQVTELVLSTEAANITVNGLRLTAYYDVWEANHTIDLTVSDGEDTTEFTIDITVLNTNDLPIITSDPIKVAEVTVEYDYPVTFTDEDVGQTYTWSFDQAPVGMSVAPNGRITWTPSAGQEGSHNIDLALDDGYNVVHHQWTIVVGERPTDEPPEFTNSPHLAHTAGTKYIFDFDATDPDGDDVIFKIVSGPEGATIDEDTGELEWSTKADKRDTTENVDFKVRVSDLRNNVDLDFTVVLSYPDNEPPEITGSIPKVTTDRDTSVNLGEYMSDPDDQKLDLKWNATSDAKAFTVHMNGNHLVVTVKEGKSGKGTVNLRLEDPWGESDSTELTIEVQARDDEGGALGDNTLYIAAAVVAVIVVLGVVYIIRAGKR